MIMFVNTGAKVNGQRVRTKKELREALTADPESVTFDVTSLHGELAGRTLAAVDVLAEPRWVLQVVGPDPYTRRNWYASVAAAYDHLTVK
jgi:hypothetical protein